MITFKQFLEATGDPKFDKMLGAIKDKAEFNSKLQGVADGVHGALRHQKDLEIWMANELDRVRHLPDRMLSRFKSELAPIAKEYRDDTSMLELLYFHMSDKDPYTHPYGVDDENLTDIADAFMHRHLEDVQDAVTSWLAEYRKLNHAASEKSWPTGKGSWHHPSVSKFDYEYHYAKHIAAKMQHWFKEQK